MGKQKPRPVLLIAVAVLLGLVALIAVSSWVEAWLR